MWEGLSEVELEERDGIAEDSLSSNEYDCASPDDISLPPLAGTPESMVIQSDVEESHCFTPHGIDSKQQSNSHPQDAGIDSGQWQGTSSQAKCCPAAASGPQTSTRSVFKFLIFILTHENLHVTWFSLSSGPQECVGLESTARS